MYKKDDLFRSTDESEEEFNEAINSLVEKGLVSKVIIDGQEYFELTSIGRMVKKQLNSYSSLKN